MTETTTVVAQSNEGGCKMIRGPKGGWRYQPVFRMEGESKIFSLCLVFYGDGTEITSWSESADIVPYGDNEDDLRGELTKMLMDAACWKPINFDDLYVGIEIPKAISMSDRQKLADVIEFLP